MNTWIDSLRWLHQQWQVQRHLAGAAARIHPQAPLRFRRAGAHRVLLLTLPHPIGQSQIFPFHAWADAMRLRWNVELLELDMATWRQQPHLAPAEADVVLYQLWFDEPTDQVARTAQQVREAFPRARISFLDAMAPTDLRFTQAVEPFIDFYVKKHVLRDRSLYGQPTLGHTNLSDHYAKHHALGLSTTVFPVSETLLKRLVVGPTFFTASYLLPRLRALPHPPTGRRPLDLHARLGGTNAQDWYGLMRRQATAAVAGLPTHWTVAHEGMVGRRQYLREMNQSKLCFSPFGYGEVCFRDYEAMALGAVLIKPDMSHIETAPDLFVADQTYVPVRWDFADLKPQVERLLDEPDTQQRLVQTAYARLHDYARGTEFLEQMAPVMAP